nr:SMI1/KNR4 family protein [Clostridium muellerianum]
MYSKKQIEELQKEYSQVPKEYLEYLSEIGAGSFGKEFCTIFGDLCEIEDFYDESLLEFLNFEERVLQFGCDPSDKALVFLIDENWEVGEIWDDDLGSIYRTGKTFYDYISEIVDCLYKAQRKSNLIAEGKRQK